MINVEKHRDPLEGLSDSEVLLNREAHGINSYASKKPNRFKQVLVEVITEPLFVILLLTSFIYFLLAEYSEGIIMLIALCFVAGISLFQQHRSRNAVDALNKLSSPRAKVIRGGKLSQIPVEEVVLHDVIQVEDGDIIPADAIILKQNDFSVIESILTGESLAVLKETNNENNVIYQGTQTVSGSCIAKVFAIGKGTALGKISSDLEKIQVSKTPLQEQINRFIKSMVSIGVIAFIIVWVINYFISKDILESLLRGLTLAMSILPEEIPVAFSTFMALGAYHLYKKKVIARSPHTVETLGAASVICVDKTGTITKNTMDVAMIYDHARNKFYDYANNSIEFNDVLTHAMWASEVDPFDAMEKSIHKLYLELSPIDERGIFEMTREYPLGGTPPIMTHVFKNKSNQYIIAVKGALEGILNQCEISDQEKNEILKISQNLTSKGYRVLGVADSNTNPELLPRSQEEIKLNFLGIISFYDPPKENMNQILNAFYDAGIKVKMITGDHADTAIAIADQIGFRKGGPVLKGTDVMELESIALQQKVKETNLFARMFPEAKLKVIEALKANNEIVAMTGDGVNDAPALKAAHIGVAMGQRGNDVAKSAASLILMDDDLVHMPEAVALGRRIYENLKKAIRYIISIHIPIILIVTLPLILFWKFYDLFSPIHVIMLELIMGPTCSIIYENEPVESHYMKKSPRKLSSTFFSFKEISLSIIQGIVITVACLGVGYFYMSTGNSEILVRTTIYTTLIFSNLFLTLTNRSFYYSIFKTLKYKNRLIPLILIISIVILFLSLYFEPIQQLFRFQSLDISQLLICFIAAFIGVIWVEFYKWYKRCSVKNIASPE